MAGKQIGDWQTGCGTDRSRATARNRRPRRSSGVYWGRSNHLAGSGVEMRGTAVWLAAWRVASGVFSNRFSIDCPVPQLALNRLRIDCNRLQWVLNWLSIGCQIQQPMLNRFSMGCGMLQWAMNRFSMDCGMLQWAMNRFSMGCRWLQSMLSVFDTGVGAWRGCSPDPATPRWLFSSRC